jgi:hypothetical protein
LIIERAASNAPICSSVASGLDWQPDLGSLVSGVRKIRILRRIAAISE